MLRIVIINIALVALPFALYWLWLRVKKSPETSDMPFLRLVSVGFFLVICSIIFFIQYKTGDPDGVYVPAQYIDGQLVPGYIKKHE